MAARLTSGAQVAADLYGRGFIGTLKRWRAERVDLLAVPGLWWPHG
jgi:hypothetical protein